MKIIRPYFFLGGGIKSAVFCIITFFWSGEGRMSKQG